jgi:hypothetical protein
MEYIFLVVVDIIFVLLGIVHILILKAPSSKNLKVASSSSNSAFELYSEQRHWALQIAFSSTLSPSHLSTQDCSSCLSFVMVFGSEEAPFVAGTSSDFF